MLQILPFLAWVATITSATLLLVLWNLGELHRGSLAILLGWFLLAGYCQFFSGSAVVGAVGVVFQTILAIGLIIRWRRS